MTYVLLDVPYHAPGFMPTPGNGAIGSQDLSDDRRKALALTSRSWTCPECKQSNAEILKIAPGQNLTTLVKDAPAEQIAVGIPATITDSITETQTNPTATVVEEAPSGKSPSQLRASSVVNCFFEHFR